MRSSPPASSQDYGSNVSPAPVAGGGSSPLTTKGDVYVYSTADARLPVGTDGQALSSDSGEATGLKWVDVIVSGAFVWAFGNGAGGALTFDGTNPVTGFSRSGSTYTQTTNVIDASSITINGGVTVLTSQGVWFCTGTLTNNGTVGCSNYTLRHASGGTAGTGTTSTGTGVFVGVSSTGATGSTLNPAAGGSPTTALGGAGGAGGTSGAAGSAGGTPTAPTAQGGGVAYAYTLPGIQNACSRDGPGSNKYAGGAGGGGGRGDGGSQSGGGGGGGGVLAIYAKYIAGSGTFDAAGGNGGNSTGGNSGGGGGGGGGVIFCLTTTFNWRSLHTLTVAGGLGGAGTGTGGAGAAGSPGRIIDLIVPA